MREMSIWWNLYLYFFHSFSLSLSLSESLFPPLSPCFNYPSLLPFSNCSSFHFISRAFNSNLLLPDLVTFVETFVIYVRDHKMWRFSSLDLGSALPVFSVGVKSILIIINSSIRNHMKSNIVHGAYWIANSFLRNHGCPLMQIRNLHNAISLEGDKGPMGLRCPFVVWQSFSVFLLEAFWRIIWISTKCSYGYWMHLFFWKEFIQNLFPRDLK
jgi:hypothetical protein